MTNVVDGTLRSFTMVSLERMGFISLILVISKAAIIIIYFIYILVKNDPHIIHRLDDCILGAVERPGFFFTQCTWRLTLDHGWALLEPCACAHTVILFPNLCLGCSKLHRLTKKGLNWNVVLAKHEFVFLLNIQMSLNLCLDPSR
jgi:hypothetical protein